MKRVKQYLASDSVLTSLKTQLAAQSALKERVQKLLPAPIDEQIENAVMHSRTLTLWVNSPVWASRLRYLAPQLLRQLKQGGFILDRIQPRIQVAETRRPLKRRTGRKIQLSHGSAEALRHTADSLQDRPLREALMRLSRHSGPEDQE
jgi:hypothetical protein